MEELISKFSKYNDNLKHVFSHLRVLNLDPEKAGDVESIIDLARRYYEDASYFKDKNQIGSVPDSMMKIGVFVLDHMFGIRSSKPLVSSCLVLS